MGEPIRRARLRGNLSAKFASKRAEISRVALCNTERGSPSVTICIYAAALHALNSMDTDLILAEKDEFGRMLRKLKLTKKKGLEGEP